MPVFCFGLVFCTIYLWTVVGGCFLESMCSRCQGCGSNCVPEIRKKGTNVKADQQQWLGNTCRWSTSVDADITLCLGHIYKYINDNMLRCSQVSMADSGFLYGDLLLKCPPEKKILCSSTVVQLICNFFNFSFPPLSNCYNISFLFVSDPLSVWSFCCCSRSTSSIWKMAKSWRLCRCSAESWRLWSTTQIASTYLAGTVSGLILHPFHSSHQSVHLIYSNTNLQIAIYPCYS